MSFPEFDPTIERAKIQPDLLSALTTVIGQHVGADKAIGRYNLLQAVRALGVHTDERRMRLAISELRRTGYPVASMPGHRGGYYQPKDIDEFQEFLLREYEAKILDMRETVRAMRQAAPSFFARKTQFRLF